MLSRHTATILWAALLVAVLAVPATAQEQERRALEVATKVAPPFAMPAEDGSWQGLSIDLLHRIADDLDVEINLHERPDTAALLQSVQDGTADLAIAAITLTAEREEVLDFSHSYYSTGLGIAVLREHRHPWLGVAEKLLSFDFLKVVATLCLLLLLVGSLLWLVERRRNPEHFGGSAAHGIGAGFWWSAVTMTTVGYGDKAPVTVAGRLLAVVWMFVAIIIISSFTAAITTSLTVTHLESGIEGPRDLPGARVGTVANTSSQLELEERGVVCRTFHSIDEAMDSLAGKHLDAVVYDMPILRYLVKTRYYGSLRILPQTFQRQDYAIALPTGSALREPLNHALLVHTSNPEWHDTVVHYLGEEE